MCTARSLFASSMNGLFSASVKSFHSAPSLFDISELCILGFSCAILRLCPLDQTMKAFIGLLTRSAAALAAALLLLELLLVALLTVPLLLLFALLLLVLILLLLLEEGTCVCGGEWELILPTLPCEGGGEFNAEDRVEFSAVSEGWVTWCASEWLCEWLWLCGMEVWWLCDRVCECEECGGKWAECKLPLFRSAGSKVSILAGLSAAVE